MKLLNSNYCAIWMIAAFVLFPLTAFCQQKTTQNKAPGALLRVKTINSLNQLHLDTMMYESDNNEFPDMSSPATVKKALLGPYANGNKSDFVDAFDHLPFKPNPALSDLHVQALTNRPPDGQNLPRYTIEYYQAKPLPNGSRCICYAALRENARFISYQM